MRIFWDYLEHLKLIITKKVLFNIIMTVLIILLVTAISSVSPVFLQYLIDTLNSPSAELSAVITFLLLYLGTQFFSRIANDIRWALYGSTEQSIKAKISELFFDHIFKLPPDFFLERNPAEISYIMSSACEENRSIMINIIFVLLPTLVEFAIAGGVLTFYGDHLTFIALALYAILYIGSSIHQINALTKVNQNANRQTIKSTSLLGDAIANIESLRYFNAFENIHEKYISSLSHIKELWSHFYRKKIWVGLLQGLAFIVTLGFCLSYAVIRLRSGDILIGHFILINAYIFQVCRPLENTVLSLRDIHQGLIGLEPYFEIMRSKVQSPRNNLHLLDSKKASNSIISFKNVSFSYSPDRKALESVSFDIPKNKITAIVGPTGSGKSTIMRLLLSLYSPDSGTIIFNSKNNNESFREKLSVVPQDTYLFNESIAFNISIGNNTGDMKAIINAAKMAQVHEFITSLPDQYNTLVGNYGFKLSGGERQRIAIARALINDPEILVLDEATSSLDLFTEEKIIQDLLKTSNNKTLIFIAHRFSSIKLAQHIIVLKNGKVLEQGSPESLLSLKGWYYHMYMNGIQGDSQIDNLPFPIEEDFKKN